MKDLGKTEYTMTSDRDDIEQYIKQEKFQELCKRMIDRIIPEIEEQGEVLAAAAGRQVIENITWRIKTPESIRKKLVKKGKDLTFNSARGSLHDIIGIRVVCPFQDDVYKISEAIKNLEHVKVKKQKNYITHPKESGYRSIHLILDLPEFPRDRVDVEVQIRSVAMNYWAILDHLLCYKNDTRETEVIRKQLKEYAIAIAKIDKKFLKLRKKIEKMT